MKKSPDHTSTPAYAPGEWRFPIAITILVLVVTSLPYVYGYLSTPPDKHFMGLMLDVPDHGQYFSWMRELSNAHLSANKLTPEPNRAIFFNLLWWGLGRLGTALGLDYATIFQILRLTTGALFLLLAYRVCAWFLPHQAMRRTAFLVLAFTSGFGWVLILLKYTLTHGELLFPLDVYIAEGNTFLCILGYPHFIAAALYIFVFDLVLRGQAKDDLRYTLGAGLFALFLGWQHAYDLVLMYGILGSYAGLKLLRDGRLPMYLLKGGLIIGILSWWPAIYSLLLTRLDPLWAEVLAQFANAGVYTPNPLHLPILLGLTFLLAIYTLIRDNPLRFKRCDDNELFLLAWFGANFLIIYIPTDFQIHMLNGWQVPIAILATKGWFQYIAPPITRFVSRPANESIPAVQRILTAVFVLLILPTNLYLWTWRFVELGRHDYPYYLHKDEIAALEWLETNVRSDDVVFSSIEIGQYTPMLTGGHAFLAHWAQTLDFYAKSEMVIEFYTAATSDLRRQQILSEYSVDFIFYGPAERALGDYLPEMAPYLALVFSSSQVDIYQARMNLAQQTH